MRHGNGENFVVKVTGHLAEVFGGEPGLASDSSSKKEFHLHDTTKHGLLGGLIASSAHGRLSVAARARKLKVGKTNCTQPDNNSKVKLYQVKGGTVELIHTGNACTVLIPGGDLTADELAAVIQRSFDEQGVCCFLGDVS